MAEKRSARAIRMHGREAGGECGCGLLGTWPAVTIHYCPMHKAAPEMLAALVELGETAAVSATGPSPVAWNKALKAIAQAKSQEVGV